MKRISATAFLLSFACVSHVYAADNNKDYSAEIEMLKQQIKAQQKAITKLEAKMAKNAASQQKTIKEQVKEIAKQEKRGENEGKGSSSDVKIKMDPVPKIESSDGRFSFQPIARLQYDNATFNDDKTDHPNGSTLRRLRMGFKGSLEKDLLYRVDVDFGNKSSNEGASIRDAFIEYKGFENTSIKLGNFKPSLGLEEVTSDLFTTFIERSLPTTSFATGEIIGLQASYSTKSFSAALGVHNDSTAVKSEDDETKSVVGRAVFAPINESGRLVHFAVSDSYRMIGGGTTAAKNNTVNFKTTAANAIQQKVSAGTGDILKVDDVNVAAIESALVYGPFSLQGEYYNTTVMRDKLSDARFSGWYAQTSWFITGETRPYVMSDGKFDRVKPKKRFNLKENTYGAFELAARYSTVDLNDNSVVRGGRVNDITFGVNWYLNNYARLMANYIIVGGHNKPADTSSVAANDDPKILLLRAQIDF